MPLLPVGNGKFVEIDEEDIVATCWYEWHLNNGYAATTRYLFTKIYCKKNGIRYNKNY